MLSEKAGWGSPVLAPRGDVESGAVASRGADEQVVPAVAVSSIVLALIGRWEVLRAYH